MLKKEGGGGVERRAVRLGDDNDKEGYYLASHGVSLHFVCMCETQRESRVVLFLRASQPIGCYSLLSSSSQSCLFFKSTSPFLISQRALLYLNVQGKYIFNRR